MHSETLVFGHQGHQPNDGPLDQNDAGRLVAETEEYLKTTTFEALSIDAAHDPLSALAASKTLTLTKYSMPTGPETDEPFI